MTENFFLLALRQKFNMHQIVIQIGPKWVNVETSANNRNCCIGTTERFDLLNSFSLK